MTMTMTVKGGPVEATEIRVRDSAGRQRRFYGELLADVSWDPRTATQAKSQTSEDTARTKGVRWTDMILYAADPDRYPYEYVLQIIGRSIVYHDITGHCNRGTRRLVGDINKEEPDRYEVLQPCPRCRPKDLSVLKDKDIVSAEEDRYSLYMCHTVDDLVDQLVDPRIKAIGGLGQRLLDEAAQKNYAIAQLKETVLDL